MADIKSQIAIKPRNNIIPPVLQRLQQKQREASGDSPADEAATGSEGSAGQSKTKCATLDKGRRFGETTKQSCAGTNPGAATSPNHVTSGQGRVQAVPPVKTNVTGELESKERKATVALTSVTTRSKMTSAGPSVNQHQLTKQSSNSNVVEKVHQKFAQLNETKSKAFNQFSPKSTSTAVSSATSSSSSSTASPSSTLKTPSPSSNDDGVVIDFRSALRTTRNSVLSELFENTSSNSTPRPTGSSDSGDGSSPSSSSSFGAPKLQTSVTSWKNPDPGLSAHTTSFRGQSSNNQLQSNNTKNVAQPDKTRQDGVVSRNSDHKQFKRINLAMLQTNLPAPRPSELPKYVDLTEIRQKYQALIGHVYKSPNTPAADVRREEDKKRAELVSLIEDISAAEEDEPLYNEGYSLSPGFATENEQLYADGETEKQAGEGKVDDVYEEAVFLTGSLEAKMKKQQQKEKAEFRKKEEKERKEKEKGEKKRSKDEKMKIKKEKELIQQHKYFHLSGNEVMVGDGVMKQDFKDMSLKQGQTITIVRLDNNPPNMWLVKTDTGLGYVSSSLIEVDPLVIRQAMNNIRKPSQDYEDDSIYDSVDVD